MTQKQAIQLFEDRKVRTVWDERTETWYFSVLDVISALTDTVNPTDYFKKMRKRDEALASFVGTNCPQIAMRSETGVMRKTLAGDVKTVLRIIQSIPSQKAEPFKQWMAQVASDRLDQMQDPELSIEQAVADYKRLGYSDTWINQRLKSIEVRKLLTDEWKRGGVDGTQYATLTDIITKEWAGRTTKAYKRYKGLKKENLRDNMTNVELLLNSLAEASAQRSGQSVFVGNIPEKYRTPSKMNKKEAIPKNHPSHRYKYNDLFGICKWDDIGKTNAEAGHVTIPKYTSVIHGIDCSK